MWSGPHAPIKYCSGPHKKCESESDVTPGFDCCDLVQQQDTAPWALDIKGRGLTTVYWKYLTPNHHLSAAHSCRDKSVKATDTCQICNLDWTVIKAVRRIECPCSYVTLGWFSYIFDEQFSKRNTDWTKSYCAGHTRRILFSLEKNLLAWNKLGWKSVIRDYRQSPFLK